MKIADPEKKVWSDNNCNILKLTKEMKGAKMMKIKKTTMIRKRKRVKVNVKKSSRIVGNLVTMR